MPPDSIAARILETSAQGFARDAAAHLQERFARDHVEMSDSASEWQRNLQERILELAAAIRVGQPALFHGNVRWLRQALVSRGVSPLVPKAILDSLRAAVGENLPADSAASVTQILDEAIDLLEADDAPALSAIDPKSTEGELALRYIAACMDGKADEAQRIVLDAIESGLSPQRAVADVLMPAQREIGDLWHRDDASISQEHLLTNATAELLAVIGQKYAGRPRDDRKAVIASVSGNAHDAGIRAAAVLLRLGGWRTIFLGSDLPPNEIAGAAEYYAADIVVLSATIATQANAIEETIASVRETSTKPPVIVGGAIFETAPELWDTLGADALCPRIGATVEIAERLLKRSRT